MKFKSSFPTCSDPTDAKPTKIETLLFRDFCNRMRAVIFFVLYLLCAPAFAGVLDDLASPVTTPAWVPLGVGTGVTIGLLLFEDQIIDRCRGIFRQISPSAGGRR